MALGRGASAGADGGRWCERGPGGGLQWGSGRCWAGPVVAEGAAGVQVQASGLGLECNREFPVS